jgi:zinc transporter, ZIP family
VRRLLLVLVVVLLVAAGAAAAGWLWRGDSVRTSAESEEPGLAVQRSKLHPGMIMLFARNDGAEPVRLAQVLVNDAFVDFRARRLTVAPETRTEVDISYPWVEGESYEIGLLTEEGDIVEYELEDAGAT